MKLFLGIIAFSLVLAGLGIAASKKSNHDKAVEIYRQALQGIKKDHNLTKMKAELERCKALDPGYASPYFNLALAEARLGDIASAIADMSEYRKLTKKPGSDKSARYLEAFRAKQASLYNAQVHAIADALKNHNTTSAVAGAKRGVEIAPDKYEAHMLCAMVYVRMREMEKAAICLNRAFELSPVAKEKFVRAAFQRAMTCAARVYLAKENFTKSAECLVAAWQADPNKQTVGLAAASVSMLAGNPKTALTIAKGISESSAGQEADKSAMLQKKIREIEEIKRKL